MKTQKSSFGKNIFQIIFALVCIGLAIYFVLKEKNELVEAKRSLMSAREIPVAIGFAFTFFYIFCQAMMYIHSFLAIGQKVSFRACLKLYLKRNVASVFLPGGGITSLALFKGEIEREGATKPEIYLSSIIYGFCGIFSVFLVAVPILGYAVLKHSYGASIYFSFAGLILLLSAIAGTVYSVYKQGFIYRLIVKHKPEFEKTVRDLKQHSFNVSHFIWTIVFSFFIELIGVIHLYIALKAIGLSPPLEASLIGYVVSVLLLTISPFMRGFGGIEVSLVWVLGLFGVHTAQAVSATVLFRIFEFWFPLFVGLIAFIIPESSSQKISTVADQKQEV